jgi:hypothetical protein
VFSSISPARRAGVRLSDNQNENADVWLRLSYSFIGGVPFV